MIRMREYTKVELVESGSVVRSNRHAEVVDHKDDGAGDNASHPSASRPLCLIVHHNKICLLVFFLFLIAGGIMTILSVSSDTCFHTRSLAEPLPDDTNPTLSYKQKHQRNFLLHMHGDSLLADPDWKQMGFSERMYRYLEGYNITITNLGSRDCPLTLYLQQPCERAEPMSLIHQLVLEEASNHPDGIIILSGTDVANTDFGMLSLEDRQSRREVYASSLRSLINATLSANRYIAVSSPGTVLGEGPWYIPSEKIQFSTANHIEFDLYSSLAREIAINEFNIPFIDVHAAFQQSIPWYRLVYKGCVTRDGEHANVHGSDILAKLFSQVVHGWLQEDNLRLAL